MISAIRWRAALPYALGLFFAVKQYTLFAVPLVWLLTVDRDPWREYSRLIVRAAIVAAAITAPFVLWDVGSFTRSVVEFQFLQPFRLDALSYLVWLSRHLPELPTPTWLSFALLVPTMAFVLRRCGRSPASFAAAVTIVNLVFFAFGKQAFYNYYFFVSATGFWTLAAARWDH